MLTSLCKGGEANLVIAKVKGSVDVPHKAVTDDPGVVVEAYNISAYDSPDARPGLRVSFNKATRTSH